MISDLISIYCSENYFFWWVLCINSELFLVGIISTEPCSQTDWLRNSFCSFLAYYKHVFVVQAIQHLINRKNYEFLTPQIKSRKLSDIIDSGALVAALHVVLEVIRTFL